MSYRHPVTNYWLVRTHWCSKCAGSSLVAGHVPTHPFLGAMPWPLPNPYPNPKPNPWEGRYMARNLLQSPNVLRISLHTHSTYWFVQRHHWSASFWASFSFHLPAALLETAIQPGNEVDSNQEWPGSQKKKDKKKEERPTALMGRFDVWINEVESRLGCVMSSRSCSGDHDVTYKLK